MKPIDFDKLDPLQQQYISLGSLIRLKQGTLKSTEGLFQRLARDVQEDTEAPARKQMSDDEMAKLMSDIGKAQSDFAKTTEEIAHCTDQRRLVEIALLNGGKS